MNSVWMTETGGPMVGYCRSDATLVITDVAGPGPRAICRMNSVTIDGQHSQQFCDQVFKATDGFCDYVGVWHCHPSLSLRPSQGDETAMKLMANTNGLTSKPVSLIYSRISHRLKAYLCDNDSERLTPIVVSIVRDKFDDLPE